MCLLCIVEAKILVEEIIPGYVLEQSMNDQAPEEWPKDWYGLVQMNRPDFIWPHKLFVDPTKGMTDEEINAMSDEDPRWTGFIEWTKIKDSMEDEYLVTDVQAGYKFAEACKAGGWNEERDGSVISWFIDRVGEKLAELEGAK